MKQAAAKRTTTTSKSEPEDPFDGWVVAIQLADTGLRVAIPILALSYIGIRLDNHFDSRPLYTLIGFFLSLIISTALVYVQIKQAYPDFFTPRKGKK